MRQENLEEILSGTCAKCKKTGDFVEEWILDFLYLTGICDFCGYDNHILVKKA